MRLVHVDLSREWRGGQTQLLHLATRGPAPCAVVLAEGAPLAPALAAAGIAVETVSAGGRWDPRGALSLRRALDRLAPDLVAVHDGHGAALALGLGGRAPVVVHRRVDFVPSWLGYRRYRRAAGVIAVSEAIAGILRRGGVERIRVVHDGVDPGPIDAAVADPVGVRSELGLGPERPLVLAAGALVAHKGHRVLVRAMVRAPGASLAVLGEGPLREQLVAQARALGVADRLHLPGHRADLPRWLRSVDVFVHPSVEEGLGQVVIEAGLAGVPVVASRAGGVPELGVGALCDPGDDAAIAAAIRDALAGRGVRGERDALAQRFSVARMVEGTHAAYRALGGDR